MIINGHLMSGDILVADIVNSKIVPVKDDLLQLFFKKFNDFESWLEERAIDGHRTNSRLLKKALRLVTESDAQLVLKTNAATITDRYWFKEQGSALTYENIRFKDNAFDKLALYGDPDSFNQEYKTTPELTNIGSFEKCWRKIDGEWWLYKQGNEMELFSELFIFELGRELGFTMAEYELDGRYIRSRDFTGNASVNFESANGLVGDNEDYEVNFKVFAKFSNQVAIDYIKMIYLDTICFNMDRHTKNYGILRDCDTGEVIRFAPNFDNNIALISRGYPGNIQRQKDKLIELFTTFLKENALAREYFVKMGIPEITNDLLDKCYQKVPIDADMQVISEFIINGDRQVKVILENL